MALPNEDPTLGHVHVHDLGIIIDLIQSSVLGTEIGTLIDVFSGSDVRLALRLTREFLQNGYTATARALEIYQQQGRYTMPRHDALRALLLGSRGVYTEEYSAVGNVFDARLARTEAQLLRLYVLAALVASASNRNFQYLEGSEIARSLKQIGFNETSCLKVLNDLCEYRFVQTAGQAVPTFEANFVPTRLGGYVIRHLIGDFTFVQHMMMDTFVANDDVWKKLRELMERIGQETDVIARVEARVECVKIFYSFLKDSFTTLCDYSLERKLPSPWCTHPLKAMEATLANNMERALDSAQKNYGSAGILREYRYLRGGTDA